MWELGRRGGGEWPLSRPEAARKGFVEEGSFDQVSQRSVPYELSKLRRWGKNRRRTHPERCSAAVLGKEKKMEVT